jgi:hypothetical protein
MDEPGRHQALLARPSAGDPLTVQGSPNPNAVGNPRQTPDHQPGKGAPRRLSSVIDQRPTLWSAGCVGTRTSGAEGGGQQTTACKRGMAARLRPYISTVRTIHRNVKHWTSGDMWTAAGMLEAETRFRKVQGYRGLATLAVNIEADLLRRRQAVINTTEEDNAALTA